ncbi:MAG: DUF484 family protein [Gammaproteobacteria bacterium]|nr:DUF484 family protein [Gammaproteobacteria bacterium]
MADPRPRPAGPSADDVETYLRDHPDFLIDHPDLVNLLLPPESKRGEGVVDLQRYMLERVRGDLSKLQTQQNEILATSRSNLITQNRVHASVLAMLGATTLEHLIEIITTDLAVHIEVDAVTLGFEALDRLPATGARTTMRMLPRGSIDRYMGNGKDLALIPDTQPDVQLFGSAATLVRSQALLRLQLRRDAPQGILAFGSRTPDKFHPGQGTELLTFLGQVVELTFRGWLDRG